jgi:hypothetical protein
VVFVARRIDATRTTRGTAEAHATASLAHLTRPASSAAIAAVVGVALSVAALTVAELAARAGAAPATANAAPRARRIAVPTVGRVARCIHTGFGTDLEIAFTTSENTFARVADFVGRTGVVAAPTVQTARLGADTGALTKQLRVGTQAFTPFAVLPNTTGTVAAAAVRKVQRSIDAGLATGRLPWCTGGHAVPEFTTLGRIAAETATPAVEAVFARVDTVDTIACALPLRTFDTWRVGFARRSDWIHAAAGYGRIERRRRRRNSAATFETARGQHGTVRPRPRAPTGRSHGTSRLRRQERPAARQNGFVAAPLDDPLERASRQKGEARGGQNRAKCPECYVRFQKVPTAREPSGQGPRPPQR